MLVLFGHVIKFELKLCYLSSSTLSLPPVHADSLVLEFDVIHSDDPLCYPLPNYPRDLSLESLMFLHPHNAVYLNNNASFVTSNATFDYIHVFYQPFPESTSSYWPIASCLLPLSSLPLSPAHLSCCKHCNHLKSLFSCLVALASSTPPPAEPCEMKKAYLKHNNPSITLDLRKCTHY